MEKNFNKGPFSVGEKKIESTWHGSYYRLITICFLIHLCQSINTFNEWVDRHYWRSLFFRRHNVKCNLIEAADKIFYKRGKTKRISREENISKRETKILQNIFFFSHIFMWGSARCKAASKRENWNKKVAEIIIRIKSHFGKWGNKFLKLARSVCVTYISKKNLVTIR
jgi:hypothetical protein